MYKDMYCKWAGKCAWSNLGSWKQFLLLAEWVGRPHLCILRNFPNAVSLYLLLVWKLSLPNKLCLICQGWLDHCNIPQRAIQVNLLVLPSTISRIYTIFYLCQMCTSFAKVNMSKSKDMCPNCYMSMSGHPFPGKYIIFYTKYLSIQLSSLFRT